MFANHNECPNTNSQNTKIDSEIYDTHTQRERSTHCTISSSSSSAFNRKAAFIRFVWLWWVGWCKTTFTNTTHIKMCWCIDIYRYIYIEWFYIVCYISWHVLRSHSLAHSIFVQVEYMEWVPSRDSVTPKMTNDDYMVWQGEFQRISVFDFNVVCRKLLYIVCIGRRMSGVL